jgi:hypothetical protein
MPVSDAKKQSNLKWNRENAFRYWRATVIFPAEDRQAILSRAAALGLSLSDYVRGLVSADMEANETEQ